MGSGRFWSRSRPQSDRNAVVELSELLHKNLDKLKRLCKEKRTRIPPEPCEGLMKSSLGVDLAAAASWGIKYFFLFLLNKLWSSGKDWKQTWVGGGTLQWLHHDVAGWVTSLHHVTSWITAPPPLPPPPSLPPPPVSLSTLTSLFSHWCLHIHPQHFIIRHLKLNWTREKSFWCTNEFVVLDHFTWYGLKNVTCRVFMDVDQNRVFAPDCKYVYLYCKIGHFNVVCCGARP